MGREARAGGGGGGRLSDRRLACPAFRTDGRSPGPARFIASDHNMRYSNIDAVVIGPTRPRRSLCIRMLPRHADGAEGPNRPADAPGLASEGLGSILHAG